MIALDPLDRLVHLVCRAVAWLPCRRSESVTGRAACRHGQIGVRPICVTMTRTKGQDMVSRRAKNAARRTRELERRRLEGRIGTVPALIETPAEASTCIRCGVSGHIAAELRAGAGYEGPACAPCLKAYDR